MTNLIDIGTGIYMTSDIAQILGIKKDKVRRWLKNYFSDKIEKVDGYLFTNFLAMIDLYVFNILIEKGVKRKNVKKLYEYMKKVLGFEYPFATNKIYSLNKQLFTEQKDLVIDGQLNGVIREFVTPFWKKIEFNGNIAEKLYPLGKNRYIVVDPEIQFGKPVIKNTRVTTETIYSYLKEGVASNDIIRFFDIPQGAIEDVKIFYNYNV